MFSNRFYGNRTCYCDANISFLKQEPKLTHPYPQRVRSILYSPNGEYLAIATTEQVEIRDLLTGTIINQALFKDSISTMDYSPDGNSLVIGFTSHAIIWKLPTDEKVIIKTSWARYPVTSIMYNPRGNTLATVSGSVYIWDAVSATPLIELKPKVGFAESAAYNPSGDQLAVGGSDGITIYNTANWVVEKNLKTTYVRNLIYNPRGSNLAVNRLDGVDLWETPRWKRKRIKPREGMRCIAYSPDGSSLAGGRDRSNEIHIWNEKGVLQQTLKVEEGGKFQVSSLSYNPATEELAAGSSHRSKELGLVTIWAPVNRGKSART